MFLNPKNFSDLDSNYSKLLDLLQKQVIKAFHCWINFSSDLKNFENSWPSASIFKSYSQSLEQFFLIAGQNYFGNKILFIYISIVWPLCLLSKKSAFHKKKKYLLQLLHFLRTSFDLLNSKQFLLRPLHFTWHILSYHGLKVS